MLIELGGYRNLTNLTEVAYKISKTSEMYLGFLLYLVVLD